MANKYVKFHGIKLADGSEIENLRVEKVTADPTPISAGRLWYNETTKAFKFSSLDGSGNIIIRQRGTAHNAGENVYLGKDHTLHAKVDGIVTFTKKKNNKSFVSVTPFKN